MNADLNFTFKTVAELAGAEATARQLEMQIGKAKALGQDYSQLQTQLDQVNASLKDVSPELRKHAEETEHAHTSHRALHKIMHMIGAETAPELGHALGAMLYGPIGAVIALGSGVELLRKQIEGVQESMEAAGESQFTENIEAIKTALDDSNEKIAEYESHIANVAKHEVTIAQALASQLKSMKEIAAEREKERKAEEDLAKAQTERREKLGTITPEQKILIDSQQAIQAAKDAAAAKRAEEDQELDRQSKAVANANIDQERLSKDYIAKKQAFAEHAGRRTSLEKDFGKDGIEDKKLSEKRAKEIRDKAGMQTVEQAEANVRQAQDAASRHANEGRDEYYAQQIEDAENQLKRSQKFEEFWQKRRGEFFREFSPGGVQAFADQKSSVEDARKKADNNADFVDKQTRELEETRRTQSQTRPIEDRELADKIATILEQAVTKLYEQPHGGELRTGINVAELVEKGKTTSEAQKEYLMAIDKHLGDHATNLKQAADYLETFKDNTNAFLAAVIKLVADAKTNQDADIKLLAAQINAGF